MKLTPQQTEDALLASMFSDAVKTTANFMVHHLDGAEAARRYLSQLDKQAASPGTGLSGARLNGIVQAIREHQIGPPGFMAMVYTNAIRGSLLAERQDRRPMITDEEAEAIAQIGNAMSDPLSTRLIDTPDGGKAADLSPLATRLLERTGNTYWYIPDASTSWYQSARALINGDSIDNYATPGGFGKLVGLNGPETDVFFKDATIEESLASPRRSFHQAYPIMTPEGQALANAELSNTDNAIAVARRNTEAWLRQSRGIAADQPLPKIPYWNSPLRYPDRGAREYEWWRIHKIAPADRTAAEQEFWHRHRYDGLSPQEIKDFQAAIPIREKMVDELRRQQRLDGQVPPGFFPVMRKRS
jgi:hypothetical protein